MRATIHPYAIILPKAHRVAVSMMAKEKNQFSIMRRCNSLINIVQYIYRLYIENKHQGN